MSCFLQTDVDTHEKTNNRFLKFCECSYNGRLMNSYLDVMQLEKYYGLKSSVATVELYI